MKNSKNKFNKRFKELREEKGLSQEKIGDILGFDQTTISKWESGDREPSIDYLIMLSDYFNCSIDYLIGKSDF